MVGQELVNRVRYLLRDVESDTVQGKFWEDNIILHILNESQWVFINHASRENPALLTSLHTATPYQTYTPGVDITLPPEYFHYASAQVGDDDQRLRPAKVYLGGSGIAVLTTKTDSVIIWKDIVYFVNKGQLGGGKLFYYRYPNRIVLMDFEPSFYDDVYNNLLVRHTVAILGMKETQTQRDFKNRQAQLKDMLIRPGTIAGYYEDKDREYGQTQKNKGG